MYLQIVTLGFQLPEHELRSFVWCHYYEEYLQKDVVDNKLSSSPLPVNTIHHTWFCISCIDRGKWVDPVVTIMSLFWTVISTWHGLEQTYTTFPSSPCNTSTHHIRLVFASQIGLRLIVFIFFFTYPIRVFL